MSNNNKILKCTVLQLAAEMWHSSHG